MKLDVVKATDGKHKWVGVFTDETGKEHRVPFGAVGYKDYTQHGDPLRRANYLARHKTSENWNNPQTAGSLSRWILWGDSTSLRLNIGKFKRRYSLA